MSKDFENVVKRDQWPLTKCFVTMTRTKDRVANVHFGLAQESYTGYQNLRCIEWKAISRV